VSLSSSIPQFENILSLETHTPEAIPTGWRHPSNQARNVTRSHYPASIGSKRAQVVAHGVQTVERMTDALPITNGRIQDHVVRIENDHAVRGGGYRSGPKLTK
jgi:hypothetical protein